MKNIYINESEMYEIIESNHGNPHNILGLQECVDGGRKFWTINTFIPQAKNAQVVFLEDEDIILDMEKVHDHGFFSVVTDNEKIINGYKYSIEGYHANHWETFDSYNFDPVLTDMDLYLFNKGTHYKIYEKMGAHPMVIDEIEGTLFAVWAPNAKRVSVIGDFNAWDGRRNPMRVLGNSGIWEVFIPGLKNLDKYKYEIKSNNGDILEKSDPYGFFSELRPSTASMIYDINNYTWEDTKWMKNREKNSIYKEPVSIYEVHLGSWKRDEYGNFLNYRQMAKELVDYIKNIGYTHIELLPVAEHPYDKSWGYQVTGYYAVTSRYGTPDEFMYFVDLCHQNNIGVLVDWVPAHFPKDAHGLRRFDGTALYEHEDSKQGEHPHWGTLIFNYGRGEVSNFLIANALFWFDKYHIDGLRVDAVASMLYLDYGKEDGEWIANQYGGKENIEAVEFIKHLNTIVYQEHPGVMMIAEESTAWGNVSAPTSDNGLGFGFKWNMGWMNDFLEYISKDPIYRKHHHSELTFSMIYAYTENFILVLSHDEVVHGKGNMINKMPGDYWQKFANLRASYGYMYTHPGKKLLFMGNDIAQFDEWNSESSIQWNLLEHEKHSKLNEYIKDLNHLYKNERALYYFDFESEGFEWINSSYWEASILSYIRKGKYKKDTLLVICNFTPTPHFEFRTGVPFKAKYKEIFNSDSGKYGGSGIVNPNIISAEKEEWDGREYSIPVKVPPLGITILKVEQ